MFRPAEKLFYLVPVPVTPLAIHDFDGYLPFLLKREIRDAVPLAAFRFN
jgi:hypothetical protein